MNDLYKIADICLVKGGKRIPEGETLQETPNGHPYIRILDMYQGRILELNDTMMYARDKYISRIKKYTVNEGDVILAIVGNTLGMVSTIGKSLNNANLTENCCKFVDINTDKVLPLFLYYSLISPLNQKKIEKFKVGSSQPKLPLYNVGQLLIPNVTINQQQEIIKTLSTIDGKIECNQKICAELEAMAKTLYDYWFVQFDYPDENGKPYRTSGGEMVWNEQLKREIPKGWTAKSLSEICKFRNGINYEKDCLGNYTYRIANVRNITASSFLMDVSDFDEIMLPKEQGNRYVLSKNDIIIARSGTPGATRLVIDPSNNVIFCGFIICCTPLNPKHRLYLAHFLKQLEGTNATKTGGSILQNVSQDTLKSLQVALPNDFVLDRFNKKIESLVQMMQNIIDENRELIQLRDWLLPMLMNGQATVE